MIPTRFAVFSLCTACCAVVPPLHAQATPPSSDVTTLDRVQVSGRAQTLYKTDDAAVATRTDTPLALVPQSVQVLPRELIEDQAARQVTDLYRSISGISFFSYAGVTLRGFRQENVLYDGLRGDPYAGFSVPQLFNIDRVEVLKGPGGALYGGGDPGGVINYVTRKPQRRAQRRLELQLGNLDYAAGSFEATGPLTTDGGVRYRAGAYFDGEAGVRFGSDSQTRIGDAGAAFDVGTTGELTLQYTDITQTLGGNRLRGVPADDRGNLLADRRWNHNEPTDFLDMRAKVGSAQYRASPSAHWDLDIAARRFENTEHQIYHEPMGLLDRDGDGVAEWMTRQLRNQIRDNTGTSANANAVARFATGGLRHTLLFGADAYRLDADFRAQTANSAETGGVRGPVPGIALTAPDYGRSGWFDYDLASLPWRATSTRSTQFGAYVQDEVEITPRWRVMGGLRWDGFEDEDRLAGSRIDGHDLSWRLGSTVVLREGVNGYASLASGFLPQTAGSQDPAGGGPFDPEQSRQWEVGLKTLLADQRLTLTTALYRIDRSNIVQATGEVVDGVNQLAALGLVRSEGAELDVLADVTERWVVNLAYAWNDARVLDAGRNGIVNATDGRFANAPRHKLGLWTRYDLPEIDSSIGFGLDHTGERISIDGQRVKSYTIYDLSWQTQVDAWKFQMNVKNIFDKTYAASGFVARGGHFPGEPRRVYLQAAYTF